MNERYTVRRVRGDGTVTFNGVRLSLKRAQREAEAWRVDWRSVEVVSESASKAEQKAWRAAIKAGRPFYGLGPPPDDVTRPS